MSGGAWYGAELDAAALALRWAHNGAARFVHPCGPGARMREMLVGDAPRDESEEVELAGYLARARAVQPDLPTAALSALVRWDTAFARAAARGIAEVVS